MKYGVQRKCTVFRRAVDAANLFLQPLPLRTGSADSIRLG